ncbi:cation:proton antiporter [Geodermatophilus aquaeductus]|uniref:Sodium/proton antiporter, CPA1 family n=1 Tax=Geodermatophilus aquaeductus TaxID=1564161 RepID=A0A521E0X5_9ACTN|nr:cation:proton antiporter [Geodermatophilus aquaeductus]SMO77614.1 sodium/proton antiporter, CPA1 family [Geodermatophilus aquaeductus]
MSAWAAAAAAAAVAGVAVTSRRLAPTPVSGPMLLVAAGLACGPVGLDLVDLTRDSEAVTLLLEAALVAVLFTDASTVRWSALRRDDSLPLRLLGLGLPLTMVLGTLAAWLLLPGLSWAELALVAVVLAPTDAALGQPAIADPRVPATVRRGLNVESGLNDGIALPFFVVLLAAATGDTGGAGAGEVFLRALVLSTAVGVVVGWGGARVLAWATARGWVAEQWRLVPALAVAVAGYSITVSLEGSGFITAWVTGLVFGVVWRHSAPRPAATQEGPAGVVGLVEQVGDVLASAAFFVFGAVLLGPALSAIDWRTALYAVLSLTVVRMLPVAAALAGSRLRWPTVLYVGWFGPRGLASIVFALLLLEGGPPSADLVVDVVALTVGLSVLLHGASAARAAGAYGAWHAGAVAADPALREGPADPAPPARPPVPRTPDGPAPRVPG